MRKKIRLCRFKKRQFAVAGYQDSEGCSRGRSSTNASLEFVEDFFSDAAIEKEWEVG